MRSVKIFVVGAPCTGKSTICRHLRALGLNAIDMDDEIVWLNGGEWPDITTKNEVLQPKVLEAVMAMADVVLFNSYMTVERTMQLRQAGFRTLLLDVSEPELRRRNDVRLAEEGWTNIEWFDWHQTVIQELRDHNMIDHVVSGEQDAALVASEILRLASDPLPRWT
jgi:hypothetical protein